LTFSDTIPIDLTITETQRPTRPQFEFKNPLKDDIFVSGIELILSPEFSKKGSIIIRVNREIVFDSTTKSLEGYSKYPIALNKEFLRDKSIEIFAWNSSGDSNILKFTGNISISDEPQPFQSQAQTLPLDVFNTVVSDQIELFKQKDYFNEIQTKLIDLQGYKKFWLIMSAQNYIQPTIITNDAPFTNINNAIDGDINTVTDAFNYPDMSSSGTFVTEVIADFGSIDSRIPTAKVRTTVNDLQPPTTSKNTVTLEVSNDNISYSIVDTYTLLASGGGATDDLTSILTDVQQSFRYLKVKYSVFRDGNRVINNIYLYEIYDALKFGGNAQVSFELRDSNDVWFEAIASTEFGTITQGQSVVVQIGDTLTKKFFLPSTQTDFRAKLTVSSGGINTGIGIIRGN